MKAHISALAVRLLPFVQLISYVVVLVALLLPYFGSAK